MATDAENIVLGSLSFSQDITGLGVYSSITSTWGSLAMGIAVLTQVSGIVGTNIQAFVTQMQNYIKGMKAMNPVKGQNACVEQQYWMVMKKTSESV